MIDTAKHISDVFNEDCMIGMARYPDKYFDLAVVDPPYGIGIVKQSNKGYGDSYDNRNGKNRKITAKRNTWEKKEWDNKIPDNAYFNELVRVSKSRIIWGCNYFGYFGSGMIVWDKAIPGMPESIEVASCSKSKSATIFRYIWTGFGQGLSITEGHLKNPNTKDYEKRIHPTQKPIALYDWIYKNYLPQGGKVIDTHLGSGSNRIAANKAGNIDFTGFELDKDYYEAQEKRWKGFISQTRLI